MVGHADRRSAERRRGLRRNRSQQGQGSAVPHRERPARRSRGLRVRQCRQAVLARLQRQRQLGRAAFLGLCAASALHRRIQRGGKGRDHFARDFVADCPGGLHRSLRTRLLLHQTRRREDGPHRNRFGRRTHAR